MGDGADRAGAHRHQHVAGLEHGAERFIERLDLFHENGLDLAARAHGAADGAAISGRDRLFACGIDLGDQQRVTAGEHGRDVVEQVARARVAMRLESQHQAAAGVALADGVERGSDLGGMVSVVVDDADAPVIGVDIADVQRVADQFLNQAVLSSNSTSS